MLVLETEKGRKLAHLYRRSTGGERQNAGRLLAAHLRTHDLTLYDVDPSLPVTRDLAALDAWRETAALLSKLGTPTHDQALTELVDADDLTDLEMRKLLGAVDMDKLAEGRVEGWAYTYGGSSATYLQAAKTVGSEDVIGYQGSLAQRLLSATLRAHYLLTCPERSIRANSRVQQHFLLGLISNLTGYPGRLTETGVSARLDVSQLARIRALLSQHAQEAEHEALRVAEELGRKLGRDV